MISSYKPCISSQPELLIQLCKLSHVGGSLPSTGIVTDLGGPSPGVSRVPIPESFGHDILPYFWLQFFHSSRPCTAPRVRRMAGAGVSCWKARDQGWSAPTPARKLVMANLIMFGEIFGLFFSFFLKAPALGVM